MEEKEFIGSQKQIDEVFIEITPKENLFQSYDKSFISESNEVPCDDDVANTTRSLQQQTRSGLAGGVNSLQRNFVSSASVEPASLSSSVLLDKSSKSSTVAKLLGEVVSDFLAGLSKNEENSTVREVRNAVSKITSHLDLSILERLENDANFKQVLGMLAEKVESTD